LQSWFWPQLASAQLASLAVAVLLVAVGLLGYSLHQSKARYKRLASDQAELRNQLNGKIETLAL
jgi:hypothetical protein